VIAAKHWLTLCARLAIANRAKQAEAAKIRVLEGFFVWFAGFLKIIRIRATHDHFDP